jgi:hypothetical protein
VVSTRQDPPTICRTLDPFTVNMHQMGSRDAGRGFAASCMLLCIRKAACVVGGRKAGSTRTYNCAAADMTGLAALSAAGRLWPVYWCGCAHARTTHCALNGCRPGLVSPNFCANKGFKGIVTRAVWVGLGHAGALRRNCALNISHCRLRRPATRRRFRFRPVVRQIWPLPSNIKAKPEALCGCHTERPHGGSSCHFSSSTGPWHWY